MCREPRVEALINGLRTGQPLIALGFHNNLADLARELQAHYGAAHYLVNAVRPHGRVCDCNPK